MEFSDNVSVDRFHAGRIQVLQPKNGYRAAIDPVFLAAALDVPKHGSRLLDAGCGAGVASLCAASLVQALPKGKCNAASFSGIDIDRDMLDLASKSVSLNALDAGDISMQVSRTDIAEPASWPTAGCWDQVFSNPPYLEADRASGKARPRVDTANMETTVRLSEWITFMDIMVKPKGRLVLIHRADRLSEIVSIFRDKGIGSIDVFPLWPKDGVAAKRVIVRGRKGVRSADRMLPGMVLHDSEGSYTAQAAAVLNGQAWLPFGI